MEELGLDVENVNALRHLLAQCKSLRVLHLGGPFSRQMTDRALAKAFDSTTPPCCPALEVRGRAADRIMPPPAPPPLNELESPGGLMAG